MDTIFNLMNTALLLQKATKVLKPSGQKNKLQSFFKPCALNQVRVHTSMRPIACDAPLFTAGININPTSTPRNRTPIGVL